MVYIVHIKMREETTARYAARLQKIKEFIDDRNKLEEMLMMLSQIKGTRASLKILKEEGGVDLRR